MGYHMDFTINEMNDLVKKVQQIPDLSEGLENQVLVKGAGSIAEWKTKLDFPSGGDAGNVLVKNTDADGDCIWSDSVELANEALTAQALKEPKNISFTGDVEGSAYWDGASDLTINTNFIQKDTTLIFNNILVTPSSWVEDETGSDFFPYKSVIYLNGINSKYYCDIVFNIGEAISGNFAPICETGDYGGVTIWAAKKPEREFTILTIKCVKEMEKDL